MTISIYFQPRECYHIEADTITAIRRPYFQMHFRNENVWISIKSLLTFGRRPGDKPLSEPTMVSSLAHLCVPRPQAVNRNLMQNYDIEVMLIKGLSQINHNARKQRIWYPF